MIIVSFIMFIFFFIFDSYQSSILLHLVSIDKETPPESKCPINILEQYITKLSTWNP